MANFLVSIRSDVKKHLKLRLSFIFEVIRGILRERVKLHLRIRIGGSFIRGKVVVYIDLAPSERDCF